MANSELVDRICNSSKYLAPPSVPVRKAKINKQERKLATNPNLPIRGESSYAEQETEPHTIHGENSATMVGGKYKEAGTLLMEQRIQIKAINRQISELQVMKEQIRNKLAKSMI